MTNQEEIDKEVEKLEDNISGFSLEFADLCDKYNFFGIAFGLTNRVSVGEGKYFAKTYKMRSELPSAISIQEILLLAQEHKEIREGVLEEMAKKYIIAVNSLEHKK